MFELFIYVMPIVIYFYSTVFEKKIIAFKSRIRFYFFFSRHHLFRIIIVVHFHKK